MKAIKRLYVDYESYVCDRWADGHLAWSRLDDNGDVVPEDEGMYVQMKVCGHMVMVRI